MYYLDIYLRESDASGSLFCVNYRIFLALLLRNRTLDLQN